MDAATLAVAKAYSNKRLNWRGAWAATTTYAVNDLVTYNGGLYRAPNAFTSGASFVIANWVELVQQSGKYASVISQGNGVIGWGDSLMYGSADQPNNIQGSNVLTFAAMQSGGRLRIVRNGGHPGYTSAQILATFSTDIVPYVGQAHKVLIIAGTNDALQSVPLATTIANLTAMVNQVRAVGMEPVLLTIPPNTSDTSARNQLAINQINGAITRLAFLRGLRCIDLFALSVDPASTSQAWLSGYSSDGTHPTGLIQRAWGLAIVNALAAPTISAPYLSSSNTDRINLLANPLFVLPGGGAAPSSWTRYNGGTAPVVTETTEADATNVVGNWFRCDRADANGQRILEQVISAASHFSVGDLVSFAGKIANVATVDGAMKLTARCRFTGASPYLTNWTFQVNISPSGVFYGEAVVPASTTALTVNVIGELAAGTYRAGQLTLVNLTSNGLAAIA